MLGSVTPRLWTPPLRELTPDTSYGFLACDFARSIDRPLDPWQEWLAIHAGELLPDGRPRFRIVLVLVARQNGKTELLVVLVLFWLFVELRRLVVGTSTNLDYARESWEKARDLAKSIDHLAAGITDERKVNGQETLETAAVVDVDGRETVRRCRYKIAASNRKGGRSLTIERLVLDELREHQTWSAHDAAVPAMIAVPDAQAWAITNQGDDTAVVLHAYREAALAFLETGVGDERLGLFEWSAPDGAKPTDVDGLAAANPNLGRRIDAPTLLAAAARAEAAGGQQLTGFKTEHMCVYVPLLDPAIDPADWAGCRDAGDLADLRDRIAACVDVSLDGQHATLAVAALMPDGRVRVEVVHAWTGPRCTREMRAELPDLVARITPRALGWFPAGPAAAVAADLADPEKRNRAGAAKDRDRRRAAAAWPPAGVDVEELRADVDAVCMGFASLVRDAGVAQSDDPLLNAHVLGAERQRQGDRWRFTRRGVGHCDAAYAAAGAVHLARTLPAPEPPLPPPMVV